MIALTDSVSEATCSWRSESWFLSCWLSLLLFLVMVVVVALLHQELVYPKAAWILRRKIKRPTSVLLTRRHHVQCASTSARRSLLFLLLPRSVARYKWCRPLYIVGIQARSRA